MRWKCLYYGSFKILRFPFNCLFYINWVKVDFSGFRESTAIVPHYHLDLFCTFSILLSLLDYIVITSYDISGIHYCSKATYEQYYEDS